jgi:DNA-nicking Smr family endonuclease
MRDVRPLVTTQRAPAAARRPQPAVRASRGSDAAPASADLRLDSSILAGDELHYARPGVTAATLRKLRRGQFPVQAQLDLHGVTALQGRLILYDFLCEALVRGATCVHIIHGKGLRAGRTGPVLKQTVDAMLRQHAQVAAFTSAARDAGGTGAVYVLLKPA